MNKECGETALHDYAHPSIYRHPILPELRQDKSLTRKGETQSYRNWSRAVLLTLPMDECMMLLAGLLNAKLLRLAAKSQARKNKINDRRCASVNNTILHLLACFCGWGGLQNGKIKIRCNLLLVGWLDYE